MRALLTYHSIDDSGSPISVGPTVFAAHAAWLASGRVRVRPIGDVLEGLGEDDVALTFDDGFRNTGRVAAPILRRYGLPFTVYVVTDRVGATNDWGGVADSRVPTLPLMTWDELGELSESGASIGAHTRTHASLPSLGDGALDDEIGGCVERITARLGVAPASFAYPYGHHDDRTVSRVRRDFRHACTTELRPLRPGDDPARLPRVDMYYFRRSGQLEAWGTAPFRTRLWLRAQGRRVRSLARRTRFAA